MSSNKRRRGGRRPVTQQQRRHVRRDGTTGDSWTPAEVTEAVRTAVAMCRAAQQKDPAAVSELWRGATNKPALVWALCRIPSQVAATLLASVDATFDVDEMWDQVALSAAGLDPDG